LRGCYAEHPQTIVELTPQNAIVRLKILSSWSFSDIFSQVFYNPSLASTKNAIKYYAIFSGENLDRGKKTLVKAKLGGEVERVRASYHAAAS
jgi:hypothetical protein